MGAGPLLIFDKSVLQALSDDEAVFLGAFYLVNMTPLFFVETLADLEKAVGQGKSAAQVVGSLAGKTSVMSVHPNAHHTLLTLGSLDGQGVDMSGRVVMNGGRSVERDGHPGVIFDRSAESDALHRWRRGQFEQLEREHAKRWRAELALVDLDAMTNRLKPFVRRVVRPSGLADIKKFVDTMMVTGQWSEIVLDAALMTPMPDELRERIRQRWRDGSRPVLPVFAPYAAHVWTVNLFFSFAVAAGFISHARPSNMVDIAYLYYLPFCWVFTSMDKLHRETVPLFMSGKQRFVWGADLKADLRKLDEYYSSWPESIKARGVMSFAHKPPREGGFLTTELWDLFMAPHWRRDDEAKRGSMGEPSEQAQSVERLRQLTDMFQKAQPVERHIGVDDAHFVMIESAVPSEFGKWRIVPPEAIKGGGR